MIKNLLVGAAAALTLTVVSPAEVSARGFGGYHGGGSAGHYSGNREGGYGGNHYDGNHEGSFNGAGGASFGSGSGYHPHGAPYGAAGGYRNGADGAWGAGFAVAAGRRSTYRRTARPYRRYRSDRTSAKRQYRGDAVEEYLYYVRLKRRTPRGASAPVAA